MGLAEKVAKVRYHYHLACVEANNILNQLGLRSDDKAEEVAKDHVMTIFNDCLPRLGYDVKKFFEERKGQ